MRLISLCFHLKIKGIISILLIYLMSCAVMCYLSGAAPSPEEQQRDWAGRVELYRCQDCQACIRFPRINNPSRCLLVLLLPLCCCCCCCASLYITHVLCCHVMCCAVLSCAVQAVGDPGGAVRRVRQCVLSGVPLAGTGRALGAGLHGPCE